MATLKRPGSPSIYVLRPDDPARYFDPAGIDWSRGYQPTAVAAVAHDRVELVHRAGMGALDEVEQAGAAALARIGGARVATLWAAYMATGPAAADAEPRSEARARFGGTDRAG